MENSYLQLTIREIKQQTNSYRFWAGLLGVVLILTVSAPFDTGEQFNDIQRFFYWLGIAVSTYFLAIFVLLLVCRYLQAAGWRELIARITGSLLAGIAVGLLVFFLNTIVLGIDELHWKIFIFLSGNCLLISSAVSTIYFVVSDSMQKAVVERSVESAETGSEPQVPEAPVSSFHQRLPQALGTDLISLQGQDHYVEAKTTQGSELILIRLSDAMKELGADHGLQVHRSWWVSYRHISEQKRIQNKPHLVLSDGTAVPVSRTYHADVKAALSEKVDARSLT